MSSPTLDIITVQPVVYMVTADEIAATKAKYAALDATTPAGYEEVRLAIQTVRSTRVSIEKRRVDLKAEALDYGRRVDAEAKRLTALIEEIESPLVAKKKAIDDEKARIKAEAEAAKLKELQDRLAAERAAEDARLKDERAKLDAERAVFEEEKRKADDIAAEQRAADEARQREQREREQAEQKAEAERLRIEREAIERERAELARAKAESDRIEFERVARAKAEADAAAKIESDRLAAAEREAAIQAILPDAKKLDAYADALRAVPVPAVKTKAAKVALDRAAEQLNAVTTTLTSLRKVG